MKTTTEPGRIGLTVIETAQALGVSEYSVRRLLAEEPAIRYQRIGQRIVVDAESLRRYLQAGSRRPVGTRHGVRRAAPADQR